MGSCYPSDSRALAVLKAFESDIRAFVPSSDQSKLSAASWWLHRSAARPPRGADAWWPTEVELNALTQRLHARVTGGGRSGGRKRRTAVRLAVGHLRVLLRDLLLVASGLRASCLVDCCALTTELAERLLQSLAGESLHWCAVDQVRAVLLDGNVFFVNADAFVREKMAGLATGLDGQMYVDVSASLRHPQVIRKVSRLQTLAAWTVKACKDLLAADKRGVLEWKRPSTLNATALAGILLCYPFVYDISADGTEPSDGWSEQENCLALCPLVVVRTAVMTSRQLELVLQEFSAPQHLLEDFNEHGETSDQVVHSPLVKHLRACCRLKLQRAIERSAFSCCSVQPQVQVDTRSLPRVAL
ncbi:hypothetical protein PRIC1_010931 [Phytophthora ramorum]